MTIIEHILGNSFEDAEVLFRGLIDFHNIFIFII